MIARENPITTRAAWTVGIIAAAGLVVGGIVLVSSRASGTSETYKGHTFEVTYVDNWYNGKGWTFRFPGGEYGSTAWRGVFDTKEQAEASARYMLDTSS